MSSHNQDLEELRAAQAEMVCEMSDYELSACNNGFPTSGRCIATSAAFRDSIECGEVEVAVSPLSSLARWLGETFGPQNAVALGQEFGKSSLVEPDMSAEHVFDLKGLS